MVAKSSLPRNPYWDTLKGVLIILVVLGHCGTAVGNQVLSVIYSFHMPLFVLTTGFFSRNTNMGGKKTCYSLSDI